MPGSPFRDSGIRTTTVKIQTGYPLPDFAEISTHKPSDASFNTRSARRVLSWNSNTHSSKPTLSLQACTSHFSLPCSVSWPAQPTTSTSTAEPTHQPQPKTSCTQSNPSTVTRPTARPRRRPHRRPRHLPHRSLNGQEKRHHAADGARPDARAQRGPQRLQHPILAHQPDPDRQRRVGPKAPPTPPTSR